MAVAIGAGCDFLTPIGHQCNTLVMGAGGYRFWRLPAPWTTAFDHGRDRGGAAADAVLACMITSRAASRG